MRKHTRGLYSLPPHNFGIQQRQMGAPETLSHTSQQTQLTLTLWKWPSHRGQSSAAHNASSPASPNHRQQGHTIPTTTHFNFTLHPSQTTLYIIYIKHKPEPTLVAIPKLNITQMPTHLVHQVTLLITYIKQEATLGSHSTIQVFIHGFSRASLTSQNILVENLLSFPSFTQHAPTMHDFIYTQTNLLNT